MKETVLPLIKENRIGKLTEILRIFDKNPYNREKQVESVLRLYPNKIAKSVFRGMAIPSLRYLGLIIGYDNLIRLSANGRILLKAESRNKNELFRAWQAILYELDNKFGFIRAVDGQSDLSILKNRLARSVSGPSDRQVIERINKWLRMLLDSQLLMKKNGKVTANRVLIRRAKLDTLALQKKSRFRDLLFEAYKSFPFRDTAGIVDIAELRETTSILFYDKNNEILTEAQFDALLRTLPLITKKFIISLGQTMGAEEKLLKLGRDYYRTISIEFLP